MVKVKDVLSYKTQCPSCGADLSLILEMLFYDDGSALVTESCPCGHYDERFFEGLVG